MNYNRKILVVDDEPLVCRNTKRLFEDRGYEVTTALNGKDALSRFDVDRPDIVIADLKMPEMSGIDVLKEIKKRRPEVIFIIITGYGNISSAVDALKNGASDFLAKPFSSEEIIKAAEKAVEKAGSGTVSRRPEKVDDIEKILPIDYKKERAAEMDNVIDGFRNAVREQRIDYGSGRSWTFKEMRTTMCEVASGVIREKMQEKEMSMEKVCRYRPTMTKICDLIADGKLQVLLKRWTRPFVHPPVGLNIDEGIFQGLYLPEGSVFGAAERKLKAFERELYRDNIDTSKVWTLDEILKLFDENDQLVSFPKSEPLEKERRNVERGSYLKGQLTGEEDILRVVKKTSEQKEQPDRNRDSE
jgi:FixJ family two-component response regulator